MSNTGRLLTSDRDAVLAREVLDDLDGNGDTLRVEREGEAGKEVPDEIRRLLQRVLRSVADGESLTIMTTPEVLTTSGAAVLLGISRPTLMKMVRAGEIPSHRVGTHTRLRSVDVLRFRRGQQERRRAAFDEFRTLLDDEID